MSDCSIHPNTPGKWIASMRDSLARIFQSQGRALESMAKEADYTVKHSASLMWYDPASSSWKTHQQSLVSGLEPYSETWPRAGMMRDGQCWPLPMLERPIDGNGGGVSVNGERRSLPTPQKSDHKGPNMSGSDSQSAKGLATIAAKWPTPRKCSAMAAMITPESANNADRFPNLETVVGRRMWQTPVKDDAVDRIKGKYNSRGEPKLSTQVKLWPTPTKHNAKECNAPSEANRNTPTLAHQPGGRLNPTWVEWLMGWPMSHTALPPSATAKSPSALPPLGESSADHE
jgi:hypothetical protein